MSDQGVYSSDSDSDVVPPSRGQVQASLTERLVQLGNTMVPIAKKSSAPTLSVGLDHQAAIPDRSRPMDSNMCASDIGIEASQARPQSTPGHRSRRSRSHSATPNRTNSMVS